MSLGGFFETAWKKTRFEHMDANVRPALPYRQSPPSGEWMNGCDACLKATTDRLSGYFRSDCPSCSARMFSRQPIELQQAFYARIPEGEKAQFKADLKRWREL